MAWTWTWASARAPECSEATTQTMYLECSLKTLRKHGVEGDLRRTRLLEEQDVGVSEPVTCGVLFFFFFCHRNISFWAHGLQNVWDCRAAIFEQKKLNFLVFYLFLFFII